jgi:hypothetical protein
LDLFLMAATPAEDLLAKDVLLVEEDYHGRAEEARVVADRLEQLQKSAQTLISPESYG